MQPTCETNNQLLCCPKLQNAVIYSIDGKLFSEVLDLSVQIDLVQSLHLLSLLVNPLLQNVLTKVDFGNAKLTGQPVVVNRWLFMTNFNGCLPF